MTATTTRTSTANGRSLSVGPRPGMGLPVREKRPGYVALAVFLIVGLAGLGAYWYAKAGAKTPVVVVVKGIPAGHVIDRADLSTVDVAGAVTAIGAAHLDSVVGQTATVQLLPNTLLQRAMVTSASALPADKGLVGLQLKPGQVPSSGLADGATVEVLALPGRTAAGGTAGTGTLLVASAVVYDAQPDPSQSGGTLATLVVPRTSAQAVAAAGNAGLVALIEVAR